MIILPAIDLKGGRCVRLRQGRADEATVYGEDPVDMARHWAAEGAAMLHIVDLDGAFEGRPAHLPLVRRMIEAAGIPAELGGGLRTDADLEAALAAGVTRAIVGTRACSEPGEIERLAGRFGDRLAVGIDARDGFVQVRGWTETTGLRTAELAQRMAAAGVSTLIVTDTARDGMMQGVNTDAMAEACDAVSCDIIASGGVTTAADVAALARLGRANLAGVIVGKALYEETVTMPALLRAARGDAPE